MYQFLEVFPSPSGLCLTLAPLLLPLGAGMFVTSVVVGSVAIVKPFTLTQRPFLRDIIFYQIGVFWTFVILWQNKVTIYSAVGEQAAVCTCFGTFLNTGALICDVWL